MKRLMVFLTLLVILVGSPLLSREADTIVSAHQLEEVQVVNHDTDYPPSDMYKGLSYDSLTQRMSFVVELTAAPEISNYNKNYTNFIYEDSALTENVAKIFDELSYRFASSIELMAIEVSNEVGKRTDLILETLVRRKKLEAKAYLAWPILIALSLALLAFSTVVERRLLQYISAALLVASIIGGIMYLPDILIGLSTHECNVYDLLLSK